MVRAGWVRAEGPLPKGMLLRHDAMVGGWPLRAELVMNGYGGLQMRINGQNAGTPLVDCTLAEGRRRYRALLRKLSRPTQMTLPI